MASEAETKSETIRFRVLPRKKRLVERRAKLAGKDTLSDFMRSLVDQQAALQEESEREIADELARRTA